MELQVNGQARHVEADPQTSLLTVLRDNLELTGCKYGCGEGQCGACTVLVAGVATRSCVTGVGAVAGKAVSTIEGLASGDGLHPLQEAFLEHGAMQCGYCTTGMIMSAADLLAANPDPSVADILRHMNGNICRCGCYPRIIAAIRTAASAMKGGGQ
jgi:aerobic-type carbon monoxide dehydrogenase small subunit (CoxS/CutS family)